MASFFMRVSRQAIPGGDVSKPRKMSWISGADARNYMKKFKKFMLSGCA